MPSPEKEPTNDKLTIQDAELIVGGNLIATGIAEAVNKNDEDHLKWIEKVHELASKPELSGSETVIRSEFNYDSFDLELKPFLAVDTELARHITGIDIDALAGQFSRDRSELAEMVWDGITQKQRLDLFEWGINESIEEIKWHRKMNREDLARFERGDYGETPPDRIEQDEELMRKNLEDFEIALRKLGFLRRQMSEGMVEAKVQPENAALVLREIKQ